jgi:signal recognition particle receptor subunit beta
MSFINNNAKEIHCKIVYYGPSLGGKTTNIQWVYQSLAHDQRSKLVALNTEIERTLFFDFLPLNIGEIRGFKTRFHLYTVPGQVVYDASRKLILKGLDGVIFVADSQAERMEENIQSLESKLNESVEQAVTLKQELDSMKRASTIAESAAGLVDTDVEKFTALAEELTFEDQESFTAKLQTIRENYFGKKVTTSIEGVVSNDPVQITEETVVSPVMAAYLKQFQKQ